MKLFLLIILCCSFVPAQSLKPELVVLISIDQMRADYFERYGKYFTGGLHRLYTAGVVYTNADLNYASSETGPGHAALGTGCYPWKSGIHGNEWIDPVTKRAVYCVEDSTAKPVAGEGGGFSPRNLAVPAIGDWLKKSSKNSKVISVSSKDRAAILMGGHRPDGAYWYGRKTGTMVTSDYYRTSIPHWAADFNASGWIEKNVPAAWTKMLPESAYAAIGPDEFSAEQPWKGKTAFPFEFTPGKKHEQMMGTPYGDHFVIDFSFAAIAGERLGQRGTTDLLCIGLSNCDYVGHASGPDSHEMFDLLLHVDQALSKLFAELDAKVGKGKYIVALSADHAVCPLPEYNAQFRNIPAKRYNYATEVKQKVDSLSAVLQQELKSTEEILIKNSFINYAAGYAAGWDSLRLEQRVKKGLLEIEAFADVYFRRDMISNAPLSQPYIQKFRNSYFSSRGEDYQYRIREFSIISSRTFGTTHGSPYRYDTHVPLIFWWEGAVPQKISRAVTTSDAAPTLINFAGYPFPSTIDGVVLKEVSR